MDPALQALLRRLDQLSEQFRELREGVHKAIRIADEDPEMALTRARKVLEQVIREVYERRLHEPPGTRPLENLLQRLVKEGHFPERLDAYANTVRKLGNVATHRFGETVSVADVYQSLTQLMPILEWYFETERPDALTGSAGTPPPPGPPAEARPAARPEIGTAIVPKGLRAFDANDAAFFLELLPGPRDQGGLPESLRFWKYRIEALDEPTFTAGVMYGPSGCGKSSLVKAGLLPRLAKTVLAVYLEAAAGGTEALLLQGLRRRCPDLPADLDLVTSLAALRHGRGLKPGQKVLIVLDQFEQWLHGRQPEEAAELPQALRQCDGEHVQCLVLVRDDFWVALSRFMDGLHIKLMQGQNCALIDLFDPRHARTVLTAFGRAYGAVSEPTSREQAAFLDQVVRDLAQDGRVIPVRLALFAEMFKAKAWAPSALKAMGGMEGVGVAFLEETFSSPAAPPPNRLHQNAARSVLRALLPEPGTDIKGNLRSYRELLAASGYGHRPRDFDDLLRLLEGELRLITPAEPADTEPPPGERYYQLTHDYLVPALRSWLVLKQRETWRGRAELRLAERAAEWQARPQARHLPAWWEWAAIRLFTRRRAWTASERRLMRRATRYHTVRALVLAISLLLLARGGWEMFARRKAQDLHDQLMWSTVEKVPDIVKDMAPYRRWLDPLLRDEYHQAEVEQKRDKQLRVSLALLPVDPGQVDYLCGRILDADRTDAERRAIAHLIRAFVAAQPGALDGFVSQLDSTVAAAGATPEEKVATAKRRAAIGAALVAMGRPEAVWPLLAHTPDPTARSYLIERLGPSGADPALLAGRLHADQEPDVSVRRALILALGGFGPDQLSPAERERLEPQLLRLYETDPDPGIHGAAEWLLRQWGHQDKLLHITQGFAGKAEADKGWYVNRLGQTLLVIPSLSEPAGGTDLPRLRKKHRFAIAAKEVTVEEFQKLMVNHEYYPVTVQTPQCPMNGVTWYQAAGYCNRLSKEDQIPEDQWCYLPNEAGRFEEGMGVYRDFLKRQGYRLPTEEEWELAARAGAVTTWPCGWGDQDLVAKYGWFSPNSRVNGRERSFPAGTLKPNDLGLFDTFGNVAEWCQDEFLPPPRGNPGGEAIRVGNSSSRVVRGGSFSKPVLEATPATRTGMGAARRFWNLGFRPVRTIP